jgi:hypothetical protein
MAAGLHIAFEEAVGWVVSGPEAGPAGTVSLPFDGFWVTVDAVDVRRLVEVTVFTEARDAPVDAAVLNACRRLLGPAVADALERRPASAETLTVPAPSGPLWAQVASAARAWFLWTHETAAPRLAALRLVAAMWPLAALGSAELITARAWEALPGVVALGRFAAQRSAVVDWLPGPGRSALAGALTVLTELLTADEWDGTGAGPIGDLRLLLSRVTDDELTDLLRHVPGEEEGDEDAGGGRKRIPQYADSAAASRRQVSVRWEAGAPDLRPRLGDFADEAFAGAAARGRLPGSLDVEVVLRAGLVAADVPQVVTRVHAWSGELLGERTLRFSALSGELPRLSNRVPVRLPGSAADRESLARDGVHVDIAVAGLPPLDPAGVRREARGQARRAGIKALVDRHAGRLQEEAAAWAACARLYFLGGDPARAAIAQEQARAVTGRALLGQPVSWPDGTDWASDLLGAWRMASREALRDAAQAPRGGQPDRVNLLRQVVQDLSAGANGVPELAQACENLARALLEAAASDGQAAGQESASAAAEAQEAAVALLREALRVRYLIGDQQAAASVASQLATVVRDSAPAGPGPGDETGE